MMYVQCESPEPDDRDAGLPAAGSLQARDTDDRIGARLR